MTEAFALVLHSHLPYARGAGRWPHGEEWVHEAILGTYLPLLGLLHDLRDEGVRFQVTIGLTPTLIEQLADRDIDVRFIEYCDDQIARADSDLRPAAPGARRPPRARVARLLLRVSVPRAPRHIRAPLWPRPRRRVRVARAHRPRRDPHLRRDARLPTAPRSRVGARAARRGTAHHAASAARRAARHLAPGVRVRARSRGDPRDARSHTLLHR